MYGYIACILVTCAYLPQAWTAYKTKVCGLNYITLVSLMLGMLLWSIHAMNNTDWALLASSMFSFMQLMFISLIKIREPWAKS